MISIRLSTGVKYLLGSYFGLFLIQNIWDRFLGGQVLGTLGLVPVKFLMGGAFWQILSYSFLHADPIHLFLNMAILAFVGSELELSLGMRKFFIFYFFAVFFGGLSYLLLPVFGVEGTAGQPLVGASAGIYGLLVMYGVVFGERVMHFMFLLPMKAKVFVVFLAVFELMTTAFSSRSAMLSGVAHLGGMLAGLLWLGFEWMRANAQGARVFREKFGSKVKSGRARGHLRVVSDQDPKDSKSSKSDPRTWH